MFDNIAEQKKESNKKRSQQNADKIQLQIANMSQAFEKMNSSLEQNLKIVNSHIKEVQRGNLTVEAPQLESLGVIINDLTKNVADSLGKLLRN